MKIVNQQLFEHFYGGFIASVAQQDVIEKGAPSTPFQETMNKMFVDLLAVSQHLIGVDNKVAIEEVDAVNEMFANLGYKTSWLSLKSDVKKQKSRAHVSSVLKEYADIQLEVYKYQKANGKDVSIQKTLAYIDSFLTLWVAIMCEIVVADRKFTDKERDLLITYIAEFCKYVTIIYGEAFLISENVNAMLTKAIILCN